MSHVIFSRYFRPELFKELSQSLLNNFEAPAVYGADIDGFRFSIFVALVPVPSELTHSYKISYRYGYRITPLPNNPEALHAGHGTTFVDVKETTDEGVDPVKLEAVLNGVITLFYNKLDEMNLTESNLSPEIQALPTEFKLDHPRLNQESKPSLEIVK